MALLSRVGNGGVLRWALLAYVKARMLTGGIYIEQYENFASHQAAELFL